MRTRACASALSRFAQMTSCRFSVFVTVAFCALSVTGETENSDGITSAGSVRHFVEIDFDRFPPSVITRDFCNGRNASECWNQIRETGRVFSADINGDHVDELLIYPGNEWTGSGGRNYFLYQRRGTVWQSIAVARDPEEELPGWFTDRPRFDVLPISRNGYHDLRVAVDQCLKWSGEKYLAYAAADYQSLLPEWFDEADPQQAETFWMIRYAGATTVPMQPRWFVIPPGFLDGEAERNKGSRLGRQSRNELEAKWRNSGERPRAIRAESSDPGQNIRWLSLDRAGVWGIKADRGFLLVPRTSYLGACRLTIKGDWLLGFEDCSTEDNQPDFQYNRRTRILRMGVIGDRGN